MAAFDVGSQKVSTHSAHLEGQGAAIAEHALVSIEPGADASSAVVDPCVAQQPRIGALERADFAEALEVDAARLVTKWRDASPENHIRGGEARSEGQLPQLPYDQTGLLSRQQKAGILREVGMSRGTWVRRIPKEIGVGRGADRYAVEARLGHVREPEGGRISRRDINGGLPVHLDEVRAGVRSSELLYGAVESGVEDRRREKAALSGRWVATEERCRTDIGKVRHQDRLRAAGEGQLHVAGLVEWL